MHNYAQILGDLSELDALGTFFMVFFGFFVVVIILLIIFAIIEAISKWAIFKKAGDEGWKAIIPIYSTYTLCKLIGVSPYWLLISVLGWLLTSISLVGLVVSAANIYFYILLNVSLARSFGKETGFALGLMFLPFIFYPMLAFGKNEYLGATPMEDIIFKNQNVNQANNNVQNTVNQSVNPTMNSVNQVNATSETSLNSNVSNPSVANQTEILENTQSKELQPEYCPNCGTPFNQNDVFCTNCGSKRN